MVIFRNVNELVLRSAKQNVVNNVFGMIWYCLSINSDIWDQKQIAYSLKSCRPVETNSSFLPSTNGSGNESGLTGTCTPRSHSCFHWSVIIQYSSAASGSESGSFMALIKSLRNNSAGGSGALRLYMLDILTSVNGRASHADVDAPLLSASCACEWLLALLLLWLTLLLLVPPLTTLTLTLPAPPSPPLVPTVVGVAADDVDGRTGVALLPFDGGRPFRRLTGGGSSLSNWLGRLPRCDILFLYIFLLHESVWVNIIWLVVWLLVGCSYYCCYCSFRLWLSSVDNFAHSIWYPGIW